jgi:hypothetical protein
MIRVGMIFFNSSGQVCMAANVDAPSVAPADIATCVRGQWVDGLCATCFAFWSPDPDTGSTAFNAKP